MSSARCRMALGPALFRLRQHVVAAEELLNDDELDDDAIDTLRQEREHIRRVLIRVEAEVAAWGAIMDQLQGPAREADEALFTAFSRDDRHITDWMEDARETLARIADELADGANAAGGQQPAAAVQDNGQQPAAAANLPMPVPPANLGNFAPLLPPPFVQPAHNPALVANNPPFALVANPANVPIPNVPNIVQPPAAAGFQPTARLPQLSLPTFSGEPMEWPAFWQSFESAVDRLPLEPVDKLNYLHGCLKGKAARAVTAYRGGENYVHAVASLRRLFGDPRKIAEALQAELINLRHVDDTVGSLQYFLETVERVCRQLVNLGMSDDSPFMYQVLRNKLPSTVLSDLVKMERAAGVQWGIPHLRAGLSEVLSVREEVERCMREAHSERQNRNFRTEGRQNRPARPENARVFSLAQPAQKGNGKHPPCLFCSGEHWVADCRKIADLEPRKQCLAQQGRCFNCLRRGHSLRECRSKRGCRQCNERHHVAICPKHKQNSSAQQKGRTKPEWKPRGRHNDGTPPKPVVSSAISAERTTENEQSKVANQIMAIVSPSVPHLVMLMAIRAPVFSEATPTRRRNALIFFDPGAQVTLIKASLVQYLSPPKLQDDQLEINPFHARQPIKMKAPQYIVCIGRENGGHETLAAHRTDWIVPSVRRATFLHATLVPVDEEPDILVGMADFWRFFRGVRRITPQLFEVKTTFGDTVCGRDGVPPRPTADGSSTVMALAVQSPSNGAKQQRLDGHTSDHGAFFDSLKHFWDLQNIGIQDDPHENDDETAQQNFDQTTVRSADGRYIVGWPWKSFPPDLPSNFAMAHRRLSSILIRLQHFPELLAKYDATIQEQLRLGLIEPATRTRGLEHFLPHHCVVTHKFRQVLDASAHPKGHNSLNKCMFRGPIIMPELAGILMRFRLPPIALWGDLEKAFNSLSLMERDREFCKVLWVRNVQQPPMPDNLVIYRWSRVPFGVIASPFLLTAAIQKHLRQDGSPLAVELAENAYVDNLLLQCATPTEAFSKYTASKALFHACQMNIREFICNSAEAMSQIPKEDRLENEVPKVLGLRWDLKQDKLFISFPSIDAKSGNTTRRGVLQLLASVFDPLGLVCPSLHTAKMFFQSLWDTKLGWDDPLPADKVCEWHSISAEWHNQKVLLPRRAILSASQPNQLHAFVDASKDAYGACIYIRTQLNGNALVHIIFAKSRVRPKGSALTIPRMELMALLIGVRILKFAEKQLGVPVSARFAWSDSKPVLSWVASSEQQPRFVENRLKEIRATHSTRFCYVPTDQNPADVASRGCTVSELIAHRLWWNGPSWLIKPEQVWPLTMEVKPAEEDKQSFDNDHVTPTAMLAMAKTNDGWIDVSRFSNWTRLRTVTALTLRVLNNWTKRNTKFGVWSRISSSGPIQANDFQIAEHLLLKLAQRDCAELKKQRPELRLTMDKGLVRLETRLSNSDAPDNWKQPILLPDKSPITVLIIRDRHEKMRHSGVEATLTSFLGEFWCPKARSTVMAIVRKCLRCRRIQGPAFALPSMPSLPKERVVRSAPFENIGIDYLGPTMTKITQGTTTARQKAWIVLITCLATRAVYLEPVLDLTASSFLLVLRRFSCRRGTPARILTDNGTQFILASKVSAALEAGRVPSSPLDQFLAREGIRWRFIPQLSPWQGGVYERLVALVKNCFKRELGRVMLSWEELITYTAEVEAVLNQRPLCHVSEEPNGTLPLRPIDFLIPKAKLGIQFVFEDADDDEEFRISPTNPKEALINRWKSVSSSIDHFWARWQKEYLLILRERMQWKFKGPRNQIMREPSEGEVVLISEEKLPRNCWPMGRIIELQRSHGDVRNAKVRLMSGKIFSRPINRLFPLEVSESVKPNEDTANQDEQNLPLPVATHDTSPKGTECATPRTKTKPTHLMVTRSKGKTFANALLLALFCAIFFAITAAGAVKRPFFNDTQIANATAIPRCRGCQLTCTEKGVRVSISSDIVKSLVCCIDGTQCLAQSGTKRTHYHLPKEHLLFDYDCQATYWTKKGRITTGSAQCPARDACELISCWVCLERLANPDCRPDVTFGLIGGASFFTFLFIFWLLPIICHVTAFWVIQQCFAVLVYLLCCCFRTRRRKIQREETPLMAFPSSIPRKRRKGSNRTRPFSWLHTTILILAFTMASHVSAQVVSITASAEKCQRSATGSVCHLESSTTVTLLPSGHPVRLLLRHPDERVLGTLEIRMRSLMLHCLPKSEKWLRSYHVDTTSVKRCPGRGSCTKEFCTEVNNGKKTEVPELAEWSKFPGFNKCTGSCSFWWCGCLNAGTSCIFYRPHAIVNSPTVYELISCPTWEYQLRTSLKLAANGNVTDEPSVSLTPGITFRWRDLSITPIASSLSPAPIMAQKFLTDGTNMALTDEIQSDLQCASLAEAESLNCTFQWDSCPRCLPDHESKKIHCQCRDVNLEPKLADPESRLPIQLKNLLLRNDNRDIFSEATYAPIQLSIQFEGLRIATEEDITKCHAVSKALTGCYSCHTGAHLQLQCHTDFGSALGYIRCSDGTEFTALCEKTPSTLNVSLAFNHAEVNLNCSIECSGGKTPFVINGHLHYVPKHYQAADQEASFAAKAKPDNSCLIWCPDWNFDFSDVLWYFFGLSNALRTIGIIALALFIVYAILRFNPALRTWRAASRLIMLSFLLSPPCHSSGGGLSLHSLNKQRSFINCPNKQQGPIRNTADDSTDRAKRQAIMPNANHPTKDRNASDSNIKAGQFSHNSPFISKNQKIIPSFCSISTTAATMTTLLSFLANSMDASVFQIGRTITGTMDGHERAESFVQQLVDRGYSFKTVHLHPAERNFLLNGSRLTHAPAVSFGAYNGSLRGPSVAAFYRARHGISLRHPSAPCLIVPGGGNHRDFFPIELVRVIPPSFGFHRQNCLSPPPPCPRPSVRYLISGIGTESARPRPSHFQLNHIRHADHLNVHLSTDEIPLGHPRTVRRLARGQTLTIHGPLTLNVYTGLLLVSMLYVISATNRPLHAPCLFVNCVTPPALSPFSARTTPAYTVSDPPFCTSNRLFNIYSTFLFHFPSLINLSSPFASPMAVQTEKKCTPTAYSPRHICSFYNGTNRLIHTDILGVLKPHKTPPQPSFHPISPSPPPPHSAAMDIKAKRQALQQQLEELERKEQEETTKQARPPERAKRAAPAKEPTPRPPKRKAGTSASCVSKAAGDLDNPPAVPAKSVVRSEPAKRIVAGPSPPPPADLVDLLHVHVNKWAIAREKSVHFLQPKKMETSAPLLSALNDFNNGIGKLKTALDDAQEAVSQTATAVNKIVNSTADGFIITTTALQQEMDQQAVEMRSLRRALRAPPEVETVSVASSSADEQNPRTDTSLAGNVGKADAKKP